MIQYKIFYMNLLKEMLFLEKKKIVRLVCVYNKNTPILLFLVNACV
ncbi:MAG: hypothetical protein K0R15_221 [Clostridiales bacterium]|jgi:hypothetical protein|nr:hypothetical protein [Clostridiales bacterium]